MSVSIAEVVLAHGTHRPDRPAIFTAGDGIASYRELARMTLDTAAVMNQAGKAGLAVAIVMRNDAVSVANLLAAELAGRPAVLLPPSTGSAEERQGIASACGAVSIVDGKDILTCPAGELGRKVLEDAFMIQLTSGSTGPSRLAVRSGNGVRAEIEEVSEKLGITPEDRILCASSIAHSYALVGGLLASLSAGAETMLAFARDVAPLLARRPSVLFGLPSTYVGLLASPASQATFAGLRLALSAGAPLRRPTFLEFRERATCSIRQDYGTTETGTISLDLQEEVDPASAGQPLEHLEVRIGKDRISLLADDNHGEIQVRGSAVASVYATPQGIEPAVDREGWYRTGDAGRIQDGNVFVGRRIREPLKTRLGTVRPELVEAALESMPGVDEAVVLAVHGALKAVVAARDLDEEVIRAWCRDNMPAEQVPSLIDVQDCLPRSPAGKVLHKDLL